MVGRLIYDEHIHMIRINASRHLYLSSRLLYKIIQLCNTKYFHMHWSTKIVKERKKEKRKKKMEEKRVLNSKP